MVNSIGSGGGGASIDAIDSDGTVVQRGLLGLIAGENVRWSATDAGDATLAATDTDTHVGIQNDDGSEQADEIDALREGSRINLTTTNGVTTIAVAEKSASEQADEQTMNLPTTTLQGDGQTFVQRYRVPDGTTFEAVGAGVQTIDHLCPAGLTVEIINDSAGESVGTWNSQRTSGDPLASVSGPANLSVLMKNATGSQHDPSAWVRFREV